MKSSIKSLRFIYSLARFNPDNYPKVDIKDSFYVGLDNNKIPLKILFRKDKKTKNNIILFPGASPDAENHAGMLFLASIICELGYKIFIPRIPPLKELRLNDECFDWFAHAYSEIIKRDEFITDIMNLHIKRRGSLSTMAMALSFGGGLLLKASLDSRISSYPPKSIMTFGTYCDIQSTLKFLCDGEINLEDKSYIIKPHSWGLTVLFHNFLDQFNFEEIKDYKDKVRKIINLRIQDKLDEVDYEISQLPDVPGEFMKNIFNSKINKKIKDEIYRVINKEKEFVQLMSPKYWGQKIREKVFIMHGSNDSMVPFTESINLNKCIDNSELFISYMYEHKEISTDKGLLFKVKEFHKMYKFFKEYFKYNES